MKEELQVLFEDNHIIVVVKPQNVPSQEDISGDEDMLTIIKKYLKEKYNKPGNVYVGLVHRLDRPTGGVMVFAKTSKGASRLSEAIRDGDFEKTYLTVVSGKPKEDDGYYVHYLKKNSVTNMVYVVPPATDGAKRAELKYEVLEAKGKYNLVRVHLITGRGHQIRVQMSTEGTPICGDARYGSEDNCLLALWAAQIKFEHPTTKQRMVFIAYPPEDIAPWNAFDIDRHLKIR